MPFAKLYDTEEFGQILVKIDTGDNGPEVRYFFIPEGFGVCSLAIEFTNEDEGVAWDNADTYFQKVTEETASKIVKKILDDLDC